jgi:hypothetical protein
VRPYWLWPPPARVSFTRGFRGPSGAVATRHSSVSSAASSAVIGVRFGAPARDRPRVVRSFERCAGTAGRAGSAGPVGRALHSRRASRARPLNGWTVDRTPLLRFRVPCSARLPRRACVCAGRRHLSGDPASTVDPRRRPPSPLVSRSRACRASCDARARASRDTVHPRTGDAGCPCGFTLGGAGPVDSARIDAARFGRDASPFSSRRCIARVRARRESCAGAFFFSRRSATRGSGYVAWSGPFSAVEACLGFRPVNLAGNEAGLSSRV